MVSVSPPPRAFVYSCTPLSRASGGILSVFLRLSCGKFGRHLDGDGRSVDAVDVCSELWEETCCFIALRSWDYKAVSSLNVVALAVGCELREETYDMMPGVCVFFACLR